MQKLKVSRSVCIGGILTALAVLFQSAPALLPGVGLALSPLSTLPIAMAAAINMALGLTVFFSSALILTFVSMQESIILLFTTGLLGITIGILTKRKGNMISILLSGVALSLGMLCLTYIVGVPAFAELTETISPPFIFLTFILFSLAYSSIWNICIRKFMNHMLKIIWNG